MATPDFFLSAAGEFEPLSAPRACWTVGRLSDLQRDDYMLVAINPPLLGQLFGLGDNDVALLILSTRHQGQTLFPISEFPAYVYVARMLDDTIVTTMRFTADEVELIAKATLYRSFDEAA